MSRADRLTARPDTDGSWCVTAEPIILTTGHRAVGILATGCSEENARLYAASPQLRAALREVLDVAESFVPVPLEAPGFRRARAALKAADGAPEVQR